MEGSTQIPRWATVLLAIAAALQALDGMSVLPNLIGTALAAFSLAALFLVASGRTRYALFAMAAALIVVWLGVVGSAHPGSSGTDNPGSILPFVATPLIALAVALLAWRSTRFTLAAMLASLPALLSVVAAFVLGVIYA